MNLSLRARWSTPLSPRLTLLVRRARGVGASMSSCTTFFEFGVSRGCAAWMERVPSRFCGAVELLRWLRRRLRLTRDLSWVCLQDENSVDESSSSSWQWPWGC